MTNQTGVYYLRKAFFDGSLSHEEMKSQLLEIRKYCTQHEIMLIKGFSDVGYSGMSLNRPGLEEMLSFLFSSREQINNLVLYSGNQLARDATVWLTLMEQIRSQVDSVIIVGNNERLRTGKRASICGGNLHD